MSGIVIMIIAIVVLVAGYIFYGKWLAKNPKTALAAGAVGAGSIAAGAGYATRKAID